MINILEDCTLHVLTEDIISECLPFSCGGDDDMDEFFRVAVDAKFARQGIGSQLLRFIQEWMLEDNEKMASRFLIVDAKNKPEVIAFYQKNGFKTLFTTEFQEDLYTNPPSTEEEKTTRTKSTRKLKTRLMYKDMLS